MAAKIINSQCVQNSGQYIYFTPPTTNYDYVEVSLPVYSQSVTFKTIIYKNKASIITNEMSAGSQCILIDMAQGKITDTLNSGAYKSINFVYYKYV